MNIALPQCPKCERHALMAIVNDERDRDELVCQYCGFVDQSPETDTLIASKAERRVAIMALGACGR